MKIVSKSNFTTYHNHRAEPYFTFVKNGQKTIEGRIKKGWYCAVKPGDHIIVYNEEETDSVEVLVKGVRTYVSMRAMLEHEPFKKLLPDIETVEEGVEVYRKFYTDEQQEEFGVVAIEAERVKVSLSLTNGVKTLKFESNLIPLVLEGKKTTTWRFFDDKELDIGNELQFLEHGTKKEFARARVTEVHEKQFKDINEDDFKTHERFESQEEMYKTYSRYYGQPVTPDMWLKIVSFKLIS